MIVKKIINPTENHSPSQNHLIIVPTTLIMKNYAEGKLV